ncbi:development-specific protein LVN1.2-like isoform X2 [Patiria miniata]|uniref:Uncharacterized protein n=1 Tax=Patiria miniata TaxID=46514 RepID=A0A914BE55_PATMI|nr:development-specific protein LVN1.2-like isoform X2 [Patiria miniata]
MSPSSVLRLFALVAAAAILAVEADNYCCTAPQYVASLGQIQGLSLPSGQGVAQLNTIDMAADFTNNRAGEEITSFSFGTSTKIKIIIDYKNNVMYTIIGQNCTKSEARGDFIQCIPKTARFDGTSYIGDKDLMIDSYSFFENVPMVFTGNASLSVTHMGCVPVGVALIGTATQTSPPIPLVSSSGFYNFTKGISDPGRWFNVPSICQQRGIGRFQRSPLPISDNHKEVMQLVSIFNSVMLPAFKKQ